jgi:hypothetical protein
MKYIFLASLLLGSGGLSLQAMDALDGNLSEDSDSLPSTAEVSPKLAAAMIYSESGEDSGEDQDSKKEKEEILSLADVKLTAEDYTVKTPAFNEVPLSLRTLALINSVKEAVNQGVSTLPKELRSLVWSLDYGIKAVRQRKLKYLIEERKIQDPLVIEALMALRAKNSVKTLFKAALGSANIPLLKMLLGKGCNCAQPIGKIAAKPPLFCVLRAEKVKLINSDEAQKVIEFLLEQGASINSKELLGDTPLHQAVYHGLFDTMKYLLKQGADVNACNGLGSTPLHRVIDSLRFEWRCATEMVRYLLENGKPNADLRESLTDATPLKYAQIQLAENEGLSEDEQQVLEHIIKLLREYRRELPKEDSLSDEEVFLCEL